MKTVYLKCDTRLRINTCTQTIFIMRISDTFIPIISVLPEKKKTLINLRHVRHSSATMHVRSFSAAKENRRPQIRKYSYFFLSLLSHFSFVCFSIWRRRICEKFFANLLCCMRGQIVFVQMFDRPVWRPRSRGSFLLFAIDKKWMSCVCMHSYSYPVGLNPCKIYECLYVSFHCWSFCASYESVRILLIRDVFYVCDRVQRLYQITSIDKLCILSQ